MNLSDYGEFFNELEMTALGKQAAAILRNLENGRDEAVKQLAESRARYGDMEARVVGLEAVIEQLRDEANAIVDTTRINGTDFERGQENVAERVFDVLSVHPSVVLADHDAAVWQEGFDTGHEDALDAEVDRWLADHDAAVRANALLEAEGLALNAICGEKGDWNNGWDDAARFLATDIRRVADQNGGE